ncbi:amino acid adenylation domain-containing protein [Leptothoe sp. EHU-05/26/07-4]
MEIQTLEDVYVFPVSFSQERLWFLDRLEPNNHSYNIFRALRLEGNLNLKALEQALEEIQQRHEVLRTTFRVVDGTPHQVIAARSSVALTLMESPGQLASESCLAWAKAILKEESRKPFNLARGPLLRTLLLKLEDYSYILAITVHHIIADVWSTGVFVRELATLYPAYVQGKPSPLPELSIQYADFAEWQRQWLTGDVLAKQMNYWQSNLSDIPPLLNLPTDYPRPAVQTYTGDAEKFTLTAELTERLNQFSQQSGVTPFMTLLAAFSLLLSRYSQQKDIVVGSPIANRNRKEIEPLIGFFINTLALRVNLRDEPSFQSLLKRVRKTTLDAYAHQDLPFERLVEVLQPERSLSHHPVFQVMFVLQNVPLEPLELTGLTLTPMEADHSTVKFDLTLSMRETSAGMVGVWAYNQTLFSKQTVQRMIRHFQRLLEAVLSHPENPVSQVSFLSSQEKHQILASWNQTKQAGPILDSLSQGLEIQVAKTPERPAVLYQGTRLTYQELNQRANQLAHYLKHLGIGPESRVGLCYERSLELIIALWGILKAGGAYVPIDPSYPVERQRAILQDSQIQVLLTHTALSKALASTEISDLQVICLDQEKHSIATQPSHNLALAIAPNHLAYVIYTSGSTGTPKGVMVEQRSVLNLLQALKTSVYQHFYEGESQVNLQISVNGPLAFDTSVKQIIQLLQGHTLVLIPEDIRLDGDALQSYLTSHQVDVFECTPSQLELLEARGWFKNSYLPKMILLGGEAITEATWQTLGQIKGCRFFNLYGPTECTVDATFCEITEDIPTPTIGRPLANVKLYILDEQQHPVPVGVPGELYVGGAGVARGYWGQPQLTAERFITHPFIDVSNARLYRTGDCARYRPDGQVEFLGRIDQQVKIRGFRIELGDIISALESQIEVQEAVVVLDDDSASGIKRLVAYVVPTEIGVAVGTLRRNLKKLLPDYMVPHIFMEIEFLPLTPNGKVDLQALPVPDPTQRNLDNQFLAPETAQEILMADIWRAVLGREQMGVHDNFFELGGDSILSIQIVARANQAGIRLTPRQIFQHQTISELLEVAGTSAVVVAEQGSVAGEMSLLPIQVRFFEEHSDFSHHFNQVVFLEVASYLDPDLLQRAFQAVMQHHDALRLNFHQRESAWYQDHTNAEGALLQVRDLSGLALDVQQTVIEQETAACQTSLNVETGPILRGILFQRGENLSSRLFLVIHHLVIDGVSWRLLLEDLNHGYSQLQQKETVQLPPKTTSFKTWANRLHDYVASADLQDELTYWQSQTAVTHSLPLDFTNEIENCHGTTAQVVITFSEENTQALLQKVSVAYNTQINDVLLTALLQAFSSWTTSLRIDLEGHGREDLFEDIDLSRTMGWFTTVFPVVLQLRNTTGPGEALKAIKEQLRQLPGRGFGYGLLRYLHPDEAIRQSLKQLPAAQISFNYLGQFDQSQGTDSGMLLGLASESTGANRHPQGRRSHLLEISGRIIDGRLRMEWTYSHKLHRASTIEDWANSYKQSLLTLIEHCLDPSAGGFTPSDFPLAQLDEQQLDQVTSLLEELNSVGD